MNKIKLKSDIQLFLKEVGKEGIKLGNYRDLKTSATAWKKSAKI